MNVRNHPKLHSLVRNIRSLILNCNDLLYLKWYANHAFRLRRFENKHKGEDCFIIGNGPSLNSMDLTPLRRYHTFGLNKIYLIFNRVDLNLSYLVAVNKLVIEQSAHIYQSLQTPLFLNFKKAYGTIRKKENYYFVYTGGDFMFKTDITQKICEGATVTFVAMQIAYYMGFRNVFLIGIDHNFKASGKPYEKQFIQRDANHFDPNYFGNQEWQLPNLAASELAYHLAKYFYNIDNREIYDATVNGKLNVFPKIAFEEALKRCKQKL